MLPGILLKRIVAYLDTKTWLYLYEAYESWCNFPPERLILSGSPEAGGLFSSPCFPPANCQISTIELDPLNGGPLPPNAGICQLLTTYLTRSPDFSQSLRILNLSRQCVFANDVARLFSKHSSHYFPSLTSLSLRLICDTVIIDHGIVPPPRLKHLEICVQQCLCEQVSEIILPLLTKVKHLGWYRADNTFRKFADVCNAPLQSLEIFETSDQLISGYHSDALNVMPSLKNLIVHDGVSIYSVDIKALQEHGHSIMDFWRLQWPDIKKVIYRKTVYIDFRFVPDRYEHLRGNHAIRELILRPPGIDCKLPVNERLVESVLPLMSTFANLEKVIIANSCISSWCDKRRPIENLSERFQFPSVRELHFAISVETWSDTWDSSSSDDYIDTFFTKFESRYEDPCDPLLDTFIRMFPNLDTLVIPNLHRLPDEPACTEMAAVPLPRLRKLILIFQRLRGPSTARLNWPRQWENVEILLIDIFRFTGWPRGLLALLKEQRNLRHLCVVGEVTSRYSRSRKFFAKLAMKDKLNQFVKAWEGRNWQTIIFLTRERFNQEITLYCLHRNDDGSIVYNELHRKPCDLLCFLFPQFYTLFWQYIWPQLFERGCFDFM